MNTNGKVYLVGAGPGDPELITLKAKKTLENCDAVVYDRLVSLELIVVLPSRIQRYYVGKAANHHSLKQEEINALLVDLAQQGLTVVRLKGGDPFVFARGSEEALHLKENEIPFEIIPGVTAGIAAAAYTGIPVTHRNKSAFAVFLTAHEASDKAEAQVPWDWIGQARNGSIIGYMGVKQLPSVVAKLIEAGLDGQTPAAITERGTSGIQRTVKGTLSDLAELAKDADIKPPALFIIGHVVALSDDLNWYGNKALSGKKIMVTRPGDLATDMYNLLRAHGAEILPIPTIATEAYIDQVGWAEIETLKNKDRWLVFTSENGVNYFMKQLCDAGFDYRFLGGYKIAAMGSGTDRALQEHHLKADFIPSKYTSQVLAAELARHIEDKHSDVIRVRGNLGDDRIERSLAAVGADVLPLQVYQTSTAKWDAGVWALLEELAPDIITFTSGSTVTSFVEILGKGRTAEFFKNVTIASIGPMTTSIVRKEGLTVDVEAEVHSVPGLVEAIVNYFTAK